MYLNKFKIIKVYINKLFTKIKYNKKNLKGR
jgi:hypothetical protein